METETPEIDTSQREAPRVTTTPPPEVGDVAIGWVQLGGATAVVNLLVLGIAVAFGAEMEVDLGMMSQAIGPAAVAVATVGAVLVSTFTWGLVAHRVPAFAELWVPIAWGFGVLSLAAIIGASGLATGLALGLMHVIATAVSAHLVPRRLPR